MAAKNIIVVGAGYAGVAAAKKLGKQFAKSDYQIILIDRHAFLTYQSQLHEVAAGKVEPKHVQLDLRILLSDYENVKLVTAEVKNINFKQHKVETSEGKFKYVKLVLATGEGVASTEVSGADDQAYNVGSYEAALELRKHLFKTVAEGAISEDEEREQRLRVTVVGAGFVGVQMAGELIELRRVLAQENKIKEAAISIHLYEQNETILPTVENKVLVKQAEQYLRRHGVMIFKNEMVTAVNGYGVMLNDGLTVASNTVIWTAGGEGRSIYGEWGLPQDKRGYIWVDDHLQVKGLKDVYAIGDAAHLIDERISDREPQAETQSVAKNIENGIAMAKTAVANIINEVLQQGQPRTFSSVNTGYAVSLGSHFGVALVKKPFGINMKNGMALVGLSAVLYKHLTNLRILSRMLAGNQILHYLADEFFHTKNGRTPFLGWTSQMGNVLWLLPLRFIMGVLWIMAGSTLRGGFFGNLADIIGWLMFLGLFTSVAAFAGFILGLVMVVAGNGLTASALLMPFASLAMMNGVGKSFGLDYWVMPFIARRWSRRVYGERKPKYNDLKHK